MKLQYMAVNGSGLAVSVVSNSSSDKTSSQSSIGQSVLSAGRVVVWDRQWRGNEMQDLVCFGGEVMVGLSECGWIGNEFAVLLCFNWSAVVS